MAAYIGKISALVTASTADLQRKLQGSAQQVDRFGGQLQRTITTASRSAQASLGGIFTPLQRIQRALDVGRDARLGLVTPQQVEQIQRAVSVAEGINKPLAAATKQFAQLSSDVQAAFLPALDEAQRRVSGLNDLLERSGNVSEKAFTKTAERVDRVAASLSRLSEIQRIVSSAPTGRELTFEDPRTAAQLQRNAALRQRAATLPATALADGDISQQVRELARLDALVAEARANLEAVRLKVNVDAADIAIAEARLDDLRTTAARAGDTLENAIKLRVDTSSADAATAAIAASRQAAKQAAEQMTSLSRAIQGAFTGLPQTIDEAEQEFRQLLGEIGKLKQADRAPFKPITDDLLELFTAARNGGDTLDEVIQKLQQLRNQQQQGLASSKLAVLSDDDVAADNQRQRQAARDSRAADATERLGSPIGDSLRQVDSLIGRVSGLKSQLDQLPVSVQAQFVPALKAAEQELVRISAAGGATPGQIRKAADEVKRLEAAAERAKQALAVPSAKTFLDGVSAKRALAELGAVQQILVGVGATASGPASRAYDRLAEATKRAVAAGTSGLPTVRAELQRLQAEAAKAAAASGKISFSRAIRSIRAVGDVSRGAFGNSNIALQQLIFGIDDFFSVTGSLDQRIRAAGNNLTQFGFVIAGTTGLIAGLAVVLGAQALTAIARWAFETEKAEEKQKQLKASIEAVNSSLERQAQLAQSIASAFKSAAAAIADFGSSPEGQERAGRRRTREDIREEQRQRRSEITSSINSGIIGRQGQIGRLRERLNEETDSFRRVRIQQQIRRLEQEILAIVSEAERAAQRNIRNASIRAQRAGTTPEQELRRSVEAERAQLEELFRDRSRLEAAGAPTRETDARIQELSASLARFEVALQRLLDDELGGLLDRQQAVADRDARIQAGTEDFAFSFVRDLADSIQEQFDALINQRSEGAIDDTAAEATARRLEALAASAEAAQVAATEFSQALQSAAVDLARTVESEVASRADQLRRDANVAESQFGADDVRTRVARDLEAQAAQAAAQAADQRRQIEAEVARERGNFERDILQGQAAPDVQALADQIRQLNEIAADQDNDARARQTAASQATALQAQLEAIFESFSSVQDLRRRADEGDIAAQQQLRGFEDAVRGQELLRTPIEREFGAFADRVRQIQAGVEARQEAILGDSGRPQDFQAELAALAAQGQEAITREFEGLARGAAPAILGLADSVTNALLQGPSRAALNVADVSTTEGARELNRLLRGDDPARDQNLVELRTQSKYLEELVQLARDNNIPIANN